MKKIIHVGILSVGLLTSNFALAETADKYAHLRNSPNNMTAEQAKQVEAGSWQRGAVKAVQWAWDKATSPAAKKAATGAYAAHEGYQIYQDYRFGDQCKVDGH